MSQESAANSLRQLSTLLQPQRIPVRFHFSPLSGQAVIAARTTAVASPGGLRQEMDGSDDHLSVCDVGVCTGPVGLLLQPPAQFFIRQFALGNVARSTRECPRDLNSAEFDGQRSNSG